MDDILLEPLKAYTQRYENEIEERAYKHIDSLVKRSGLNVEQNRQTVAQYRTECAACDRFDKMAARQKGAKIFLIICAVLGFVLAAVGIYLLVKGSTVAGAAMLPAGLVVAAGSIVLIVLVLNSRIRNNSAQADKHREQADKLLAEAWEQMRPFNSLFESTDTKNLIEATVPLLKIDDNFDMRRYDYLNGKYGFGDNDDIDCSTIELLSGEILGNPFLVERELVHTTVMQTYTGSLTISWTTTYTDSEGHRHTQHHTQTLHASVDKPMPDYSEYTRLIYGNDAAPDLVFSHSPSHAEKLNEKQLERRVKSGAKEIQKLQKEQIKAGGSTFTEMGNAEFDVLFGALDRNNEVQFRLLFTPLAQKNMLSLMQSNDGYGDDFAFNKRKCINVIESEHSAMWDLDTSYSRYASYEYDNAVAKFVTFNKDYFKHLFFELAPLLSVPLYQQHKPKEYIYKTEYSRNYTNYEAECAVNRIGQEPFRHEATATQTILKTDLLSKNGSTDEVRVRAYSFRTEPRVDYVSMRGGDGAIHSVPVPWTEYIPVDNTSTVKLNKIGLSDKEFDRRVRDQAAQPAAELGSARSYARGLLCCLTQSDDAAFDRFVSGLLDNQQK